VTDVGSSETDPDRRGVLVLDADGQCGLQLVRSLGRLGVPVTAGSPRRRSLGARSRYSVGGYRHPPLADRDAFLSHLRNHLSAADYEFVFAPGDRSSSLCSRYKRSLDACGPTLAVPAWDQYRRAFDKAALFALADSLDVPTPETHAPSSLAELDALADRIDYPVVVKPRSKSLWTADGDHRYTLVSDENYATSPTALRRVYRRLLDREPALETHRPLVQSYVPGTTTTTVVLADAGDVVQWFQEERLRTYPASGGNSALLGAVRSPRMLTYARRVIAALDWTGPAMVEFMRRPDGEYVLIEVNGRYWGSLPFAVTCGFDVPRLHYRQLRGASPDELRTAGVGWGYRTDIVGRRLFYEDCKWLCERLRAGDLGAVPRFLWAFPTTDHVFVSRDDPGPTVATLEQAVELGCRGLLGRLADSLSAL
jgi:predicted ATP-grasp superfamily ATP-dependent carboligase